MEHQEGQLRYVAMKEMLWLEAAVELFQEDWQTHEQAEHYGLALADAVASDEMSVSSLREMTNEANQLDKEAVEKADGDIEHLSDEDYLEAVARRIANQSLRYALDLTKNHRLFMQHKADYRRRNGIVEARMPGLGSHDWLLR